MRIVNVNPTEINAPWQRGNIDGEGKLFINKDEIQPDALESSLIQPSQARSGDS